jgi:hypothetical protein
MRYLALVGAGVDEELLLPQALLVHRRKMVVDLQAEKEK